MARTRLAAIAALVTSVAVLATCVAVDAGGRTTQFTSSRFRPPISFQLPGGLTVGADEPGIVFVDAGSPAHGASIEANIMDVRRVWDPRNGHLTAAPRSLVAWAKTHPDLRSGPVRRFHAGRLHGMSVDATVVSAPAPGTAISCDPGCVKLVQFPAGAVYVTKGEHVRFIQLDTAGHRLAIEIDALPVKFGALAAKLQTILTTLDFTT